MHIPACAFFSIGTKFHAMKSKIAIRKEEDNKDKTKDSKLLAGLLTGLINTPRTHN